MGCDIHMYKEKLVGGVWVTADEWTPYDYGEDERGMEVEWKNRFTDRNYNLFGLLSNGVRHEFDFSFDARGMPFNASKEVAAANEEWDSDGHSHSWLYLFELKEMLEFLKTATIPVSGMMHREQLAKLEASEPKDWNLLYPYSSWCSDTDNYLRFKYDVPADFIIGTSLQKLIDMFDGIDGDNHRIVFWFDN